MNLESITTQYVSLLESAVNNTAAGNLQNKIEKLRVDIVNSNINMKDIYINNPAVESELVAYFGSSIRA